MVALRYPVYTQQRVRCPLKYRIIESHTSQQSVMCQDNASPTIWCPVFYVTTVRSRGSARFAAYMQDSAVMLTSPQDMESRMHVIA